ncbi:MAG: hypothetical protein GY761_08925 [Hyphomicrobiales bacterium]|nr:hypothetical protein [Hyphomicrobiales bacterium]
MTSLLKILLRCRPQATVMLMATLLNATALTPSKADTEDATYQNLRNAFAEQYGNRLSSQKFTEYLNLLFRTVDFDGQGISQSNINLHRKMRSAQMRALVASRILMYDLDADGIVSRVEVETALLARNRPHMGRSGGKLSDRLKSRFQKQVDSLFEGDPNKDGRLELSEFGELSRQSPYNRSSARWDHEGVASAFLALDPNQDGSVTQAEARSIMARAYDGVKISPQIFATRGNFRPKDSCKVPDVPAGAKVILVGAYEGSSVSSVTVAGQDEETSTNKLVVENGKEPLYLLLTSYTPMVWRLTGATDRIANVVVAGRADKDMNAVMAGVTGIAKGKVSFLSTRSCIPYFYKLGGIEGARAKAAMFNLVGRKPDYMLGMYTLHEMQLPSGNHKVAKSRHPSRLTIVDGDKELRQVDEGDTGKAIRLLQKRGSWPELERSLLRFNPGGVVKINVKSVVSDAPTHDYEVLPQETGLLQLVSSGALNVISRGQFKIVKKIRYPARLTGSHSVKFLLKAGVPEPDGNPGHSCVFSEDKGEPVAGHC